MLYIGDGMPSEGTEAGGIEEGTADDVVLTHESLIYIEAHLTATDAGDELGQLADGEVRGVVGYIIGLCALAF